jgi:hypothetical protein
MSCWAHHDHLRDCAAITAAFLLAAAVLRPFQNTPYIDDWTYAWSVERLLATGRLEFIDFSAQVNPAQIVWGWLFTLPFGFSFTALRWSTWTLAVAAVCGLYLMLRRLDVGGRDALLGAATLAVYPVFSILTTTFMTDIPFVSLTVLGCVAMVGAVRARSTWLLALAAVFAALAAAVRAVGVVMPMAMCATLLFTGDRWGRQSGRWAIGVLPLVAFAGMTIWARAHIHHVADLTWIVNSRPHRLEQLQHVLQLMPRMIVETASLMIGSVGLAMLPLAVGIWRNDMLRTAAVVALVLGGALAMLWLAGVEYILPFIDSATWRFDGLGFTPLLVPYYSGSGGPEELSLFVLAIGVLSIAAAATAVFKARRRSSAATAFLVWMLLGHAGIVTVLWLIHDRYTLVFVPLAVSLLLSARPIANVRSTVVGLLLFAAVGAAGTIDHLRYNHALWTAVASLDRSGVPIREVDAGYIVNGWRQYAHPEHAPRDAAGAVDVPGVNGGASLPYAVGNSIPAGWIALQQFPYRRLLGPDGTVYTLRRQPGDRSGAASRGSQNSLQGLEKAAAMQMKASAWTGMVPVEDTALYVTDTGHTRILRKDSPAVARTVRELAATDGHAIG